MKVKLVNPTNSFTKEVKVGWSWTLFFFSSFFGLPLFLRGLYGWGALFLFISCVQLFLLFSVLNSTSQAPGSTASFAMLALSVVMAAKGNEFTAKSLLKKGWKFSDPTGPEAGGAKLKWRLA